MITASLHLHLYINSLLSLKASLQTISCLSSEKAATIVDLMNDHDDDDSSYQPSHAKADFPDNLSDIASPILTRPLP
jgi:hypothetical protein